MENTVNINKNWIEIIILISLFNFLFLGSEYLFDNMIAKVANPSKVVIAQSYVLGASVVGFVLYPIIKKILDNKTGIKNTKNIVIHRKLTNFKVNLINLLINTFSFNSTLIFYKH